MSLNDIPVPIQRQQAFREALFRLGYRDEEVKCSIGASVSEEGFVLPPGHKIVATHLVLLEPVFHITCGSVPASWTMAKVAPLWNAVPHEARQMNFVQHVSLLVFVDLMQTIKAKGIVVPNMHVTW